MRSYFVFAGVIQSLLLSDLAFSKPSLLFLCHFSYREKGEKNSGDPKTDFVLPKSEAFEFSLNDGVPGYQIDFEFPNATSKINLQIAKVFVGSDFSKPPVGLSVIVQTPEEKLLLDATTDFKGSPDSFLFTVPLNDESNIEKLNIACAKKYN